MLYYSTIFPDCKLNFCKQATIKQKTDAPSCIRPVRKSVIFNPKHPRVSAHSIGFAPQIPKNREHGPGHPLLPLRGNSPCVSRFFAPEREKSFCTGTFFRPCSAKSEHFYLKTCFQIKIAPPCRCVPISNLHDSCRWVFCLIPLRFQHPCIPGRPAAQHQNFPKSRTKNVG